MDWNKEDIDRAAKNWDNYACMTIIQQDSEAASHYRLIIALPISNQDVVKRRECYEETMKLEHRINCAKAQLNKILADLTNEIKALKIIINKKMEE